MIFLFILLVMIGQLLMLKKNFFKLIKSLSKLQFVHHDKVFITEGKDPISSLSNNLSSSSLQKRVCLRET